MAGQSKTLYGIAALLALLNAFAHVAALVTSDIASTAIPFIVAAIVWLLFAVGLKAGQRWLGYIVFLVALIETVIAFGILSGQTFSLWMAILAVCILLALTLFAIIWRSSMPESTQKMSHD